MALDESKLIDLLERIDSRLSAVEERLDAAPTPEAESLADGRHALAQEDVEPELPDPTPEAHDRWAVMADSMFENWTPSVEKGQTLDKAGMIESFVKGGPLWLAAYAHDFLMALPYNWRQAMVSSVEGYAPNRARELGRDILRHDTTSAAGWAYSRGLEQADKRLNGLVEGRNAG